MKYDQQSFQVISDNFGIKLLRLEAVVTGKVVDAVASVNVRAMSPPTVPCGLPVISWLWSYAVLPGRHGRLSMLFHQEPTLRYR